MDARSTACPRPPSTNKGPPIMKSSRCLILATTAAFLSPLIRGAVNESNSSTCCNKVAVVKQYIYTNSILGSCPTFEATIGCGGTLVISDYYEADQYHT